MLEDTPCRSGVYLEVDGVWVEFSFTGGGTKVNMVQLAHRLVSYAPVGRLWLLLGLWTLLHSGKSLF